VKKFYNIEHRGATLVNGKPYFFKETDAKTFYLRFDEENGENHINGTLRNGNNYLNTNIYSYLKTSGGQSSNLYLNVVYFFSTSVK
jgi:hypothetical protein